MSNTSHNVRVTYAGETTTLKQLATRLGLTYSRLHAYYRRRGLPLDEAVARVRAPGINRPYRYRPTSGSA